MKYEWIPLVRLGPLKFGSPVWPYVEDGTLVPAPFSEEIRNLGNLPDDDPDDDERFTYPDDDETNVYVEDGRIVDIACYNQCVLRGQNLIGPDYEIVRELIGSEPAGEPDIEPVIDDMQEVYEFKEAGAQIWVKDGKVVTIFCDDGGD